MHPVRSVQNSTWRTVLLVALAVAAVGVLLLLARSRGPTVETINGDVLLLPGHPPPSTGQRKIAVTVLFGTGNRAKAEGRGNYGLLDGACILRQSMLKYKPRDVDLDFVGLVRSTDDVDSRLIAILSAHCGFTFRVADNSTHVQTEDIQDETLREAVEERPVGTLELLKLHSLLMVEYEVVLCLDADVMFVGPFDDLLVPMPRKVPYRQTPDCNGGMVVYFPRHDGARHVKGILKVLRSTPYSWTTGYARTTYGARINAHDGLAGGPMLQGLLPYYSARILKLKYRKSPIAIRPCLHNYYVTLPKFKVCENVSKIHSVHFKGASFPKPWECNLIQNCTRNNCKRFMRQFLDEHRLLLQTLPRYVPVQENGCRPNGASFYGVLRQLHHTMPSNGTSSAPQQLIGGV